MVHFQWALLAGVTFAAAILAGDRPGPIPKDTLPEKLNCTEAPLGLDALPPIKEAHVQLGRRLFFDPILSADNTVACASCHHPDHAFASAEPRPRGIRGQVHSRRAPTLINRAFGSAFFWDGRTATLEEQALMPIADPKEMGSSVSEAVAKISKSQEYKAAFEAAFDDGVTAANLGRALASFERTLMRGNSPVDQFRRNGQHAALTPLERHGLWLYESKGQCWKCHSGPNFTDEEFHNTGVGWGTMNADVGRLAVTKKEDDRGKFKTPTLRGAALRAPFMHDGSLKTLEDVIEFYSKGGTNNPHLDPKMTPLNLSKDEVLALVAFLKAL